MPDWHEPPFEYDRACSSLNAAPQTHNDGIFLSGMLHLMYKLSQNDCFSRERPYLLIRNVVSKLDAPTSILVSRGLLVIVLFINNFISSSFSQFIRDFFYWFVLVFDFCLLFLLRFFPFKHCLSNQSGIFEFYLTPFGWIIDKQTTIFHRKCEKLYFFVIKVIII